MSNAVVEVLRAARAKIEDPKHWGRGWYAHAANGRRRSGADPDAVNWCAAGAVDAVASNSAVGFLAYGALSGCLPEKASALANFNDRRTTTHADILALYDCAIAKAEAEGGE